MHLIKMKSLAHCIAFANEHKIPGFSATEHEASSWTDHYSFDGFIQDFYALKNKNKKEKTVSIVKEHMNHCIDRHRHHYVEKNIFEEITDISGSYVDMDRFLRNDPECMVDFKSPLVTKRMNVFFNYQNNANFSDEIEFMGVIIFSLLKMLQNKGFNLYAVGNTSNAIFSCIPFSTVYESAVYPQLELCLLNLKGFFRRIGFALEESCPKELREKVGIFPSGGYGQSQEVTKNMIVKYTGIQPDVLIHSSHMSSYIDDLPKMCNEVIKAVLGIEHK